jgi:endogenous inhibitor of DNA gyrase (YacG/DUF329 family)
MIAASFCFPTEQSPNAQGDQEFTRGEFAVLMSARLRLSWGMPEASDPKGRSCPICHRPVPAGQLRSFCSKRCADVDLHRWLSGSYALPAAEVEDDEASATGGPALAPE